MADIPRIIHMVWIGRVLPQHLMECMSSWSRLHPDWQHRLWRDGDLEWVRNRGLFEAARSIVPADAVEQFQSDIARYAILQRYGGLYVDCDTEARRPVDQALAGYTAFAAYEDDRWIGNTYLAAAPEHPVMTALVDRLQSNVAVNRGRRPNVLSGPKYLTPIWREFGCHVDPRHLWFPYSYTDVRRDSVPTDYGFAYAVHHWDHTRRVLAARRARRH